MSFYREAMPDYVARWPMQYAHRERKKEKGLCINCSEPVAGGTRRCAKHRAMHNKAARARNAKR